MIDREIIVKGALEAASMSFDSSIMKDSEALHHVLCGIDPGDDYTVTFKTIK